MEKIYIIGHKNPDTDSICSAIALSDYMSGQHGENKGKNYIPARSGQINPETEFVLDRFGVPAPDMIEDASGLNLFLVDHNEMSQSPNGIENARIVGVIDHHKINFKISEPIYFYAKPAGSTATIIAQEYIKNNREIKKEIAGILLCAILSDTVVFKSRTTTDLDKNVSKILGDIAGIEDIHSFGIEVKKAKASISGMSNEQVIYSDFKDFNFSGKKVGIGQIEVVGFEQFNERAQDIMESLDSIRNTRGYDLVVLMVTDIIKEGSELIAYGDVGKVESAFGKLVEGNRVYLDGVMSRKKEIVPDLERVF